MCSITRIISKVSFYKVKQTAKTNWLFVLLWLVGCYAPVPLPLHPTRDELAEHKFYTYAVSEALQNEYGWRESLVLIDWRQHCGKREADEAYNPLFNRYINNTDETIIMIAVDPWETNWEPVVKEEPVDLNYHFSE